MRRKIIAKTAGRLASACLLACASSPAFAATVVQSLNFSITQNLDASDSEITADKTQVQTDYVEKAYTAQFSKPMSTTTSLSFNGFDSALGTLQGVTIEFWGERTLATSVSYAVSGVAFGSIRGLTPTTTRVSVGGVGVTSNDRLGRFSGRYGRPFCPYLAYPFCIVRQWDQEGFTGRFDAPVAMFLADQVNVDLSTDMLMQADVDWGGNGTWRSFFGTNSDLAWSGGVNLTYRYEPGSPAGAVPEPSSWALMIAGFGLSGALLRRARRGLPDRA